MAARYSFCARLRIDAENARLCRYYSTGERRRVGRICLSGVEPSRTYASGARAGSPLVSVICTSEQMPDEWRIRISEVLEAPGILLLWLRRGQRHRP